MTKMTDEDLRGHLDNLELEGYSALATRLRSHIAALTKELDEARRRTWVQCTTVSNKCLGGCRSMAEHDRYRQHALMQEVENLRPLEALHEDMTRLKREAENECNTLRERVSVLEHDIKGYSELMLLLGDALGMDSVTDVALVERVRRVVKERDAADIERNEASFRMEAAESRLAAIRQRAGDEDALECEYEGVEDGRHNSGLRAVARFIVSDDTPAHEEVDCDIDGRGRRVLSTVPTAQSEPSTAEAFATVRGHHEAVAMLFRLPEDREQQARVNAALSLLERRMELLEQQYNACANRALASAEKCDHLTRRMGAMGRALRNLRDYAAGFEAWTSPPPVIAEATATLTDAPDVFTIEEVEAALEHAWRAGWTKTDAAKDVVLRRLDALRKK